MPTRTSRSEKARTARSRRLAGVSIVELAVVLAIVGVLMVLAVPVMTRWQDDQRLKGAARSIGDLLLLARSEAIRTGRHHVVYFGPPGTADAGGNAVEAGSAYVPMLVVDDGAPATSDCRIDAAEPHEWVPAVEGLAWGVSQATAAAPGDAGAAAFAPPQASGHTVRDSTGTLRNWVLFRGDGFPLSFTAAGGDCGAISAAGTGGGAFYITNGKRDYAVVLSPLGAVRVHVWQPNAGWSS